MKRGHSPRCLAGQIQYQLAARAPLAVQVQRLIRLGLVALPLFLAALIAPDYRLAIAMVSLTYASLHLSVATQFTVFQTPAASKRATAAALPILVGTRAGPGLIPPIIGAVSDRLTPRFGADALRYALLIVPVLCLSSSATFHWAAGRVGPTRRRPVRLPSRRVMTTPICRKEGAQLRMPEGGTGHAPGRGALQESEPLTDSAGNSSAFAHQRRLLPSCGTVGQRAFSRRRRDGVRRNHDSRP